MCKTIKQKIHFKAPPDVIYSLLTDSKKYASLTVPKEMIPSIELGWRKCNWDLIKNYLEKQD